MKLRRTVHFDLAWVCLVPLANVLFLVFVFFALGFKFAAQPGLRIEAPLSAFALRPQPDSVMVTISGQPLPQIYFGQEKIVPAELGARLERIAARDKSLVIRADRTAPNELVVFAANEGLKRGFSVVLATGREPE